MRKVRTVLNIVVWYFASQGSISMEIAVVATIVLVYGWMMFSERRERQKRGNDDERSKIIICMPSDIKNKYGRKAIDNKNRRAYPRCW